MDNKEIAASSIQSGLYYLQRTTPELSAYNVVFSAKISGAFNFDDLQSSALRVQQQHEALRQTMVLRDGVPTFRPDNTQQLKINAVDITQLNAEDQFNAIHSDSLRPFNLDADLCVRLTIFKMAEQEHVLLVTAHHACFDFWSLALLIEELGAGYVAATNTALAPQDKPLQFSDWLNAIGEPDYKNKIENQCNHVAEVLDGAPTQLDLACDYTRPREMAYTGKSLAFEIPEALTQSIEQAAKAQGVTVFMFLLSAYQVLLHRYTGQDDILIGSPSAGRSRRKFHGVMGNFVNTIVTRSKVCSQTTFAEKLAATFSSVADAVKHDAVPFVKLVEKLVTKRDPSRSPLVQAYFAWDKLPQLEQFSHFFSRNSCGDSLTWHGLTLSPYWIPQQEGQFDIAFEMGAKINGALTGTLKYRDDLFCAQSMQNFIECYINLLAEFTRDSQINIYNAAILNEQQQHKSIALSKPCVELGAGEETLPALFSQWAASRAGHNAIEDESGVMTYAELDWVSTAIANYLRNNFAVTGKRVGVYLERDRYLLATLLGVLKAGAAYVPIDPKLPTARAKMIIEDADLSVLLTSNLPDALRSVGQQSTVLWPTQLPILLTQPAMVLPELVSPSDSAYVIFTSGSTGRPKGVEISHTSAANLLRSFAQQPGFTPDDKLLAITTIAFDISILELFLPITHGGTTCIVGRESAGLPDALMACIERFSPSWMQATPATWKMLFTAGWQGRDSLTVLCGGEPLPQSLAEKLHAACGAVYNVYGPTETTIWSTFSAFNGGDVVIGQPLANTQTYILDRNYNMVPQGVVGELFIAGQGLAKGYFNQPELTAKSFVNNPHANGLIYHTGDLARVNKDGQLECLGRIGNQVKIRGFRIELDDIEENIRLHGAVKDVAVTANTKDDERFLTCYFVLHEGQSLDVSEIKHHAKGLLPQYMVPAYFMEIPVIPLNSNGKVDKAKLPSTDDITLVSREVIAPNTEDEIKLLGLWKALLGVETLCITDDFFDVGGHSLLAVQLASQLKKEFEAEVSDNFVLSNPTIEKMAVALASHTDEQGAQCLVTLNAGNASHTPLFLMHPIGGTVYCYLALNQYLDKEIPVYAFQSPGIEDADEFEVAIEDIAKKYVDIIVEQYPTGIIQLGGWCFGGVIAYEAADQLQKMGREISGLYLFDTRAPIVKNHPSDGDDATLLSWFARDLAVPMNKTLTITPDELRAIDCDEQFNFVLQQAKAAGVVAQDVDEDKLHNYFQVYIANGMALQMYEEKIVDVPLRLYVALDESDDYGQFLGWDELIGDNFDAVYLPGTHNSIMYKPNVEALAKDINQTVAQQHVIKTLHLQQPIKQSNIQQATMESVA